MLSAEIFEGDSVGDTDGNKDGSSVGYSVGNWVEIVVNSPKALPIATTAPESTAGSSIVVVVEVRAVGPEVEVAVDVPVEVR